MRPRRRNAPRPARSGSGGKMPTDSIIDAIATLALGVAFLSLSLRGRAGRIVPAAALLASLLAQYLAEERGVYLRTGWTPLERVSLVLTIIMMIVGLWALIRRTASGSDTDV
jgi:hypothetical protein